jgi:hypothetical protein
MRFTFFLALTHFLTLTLLAGSALGQTGPASGSGRLSRLEQLRLPSTPRPSKTSRLEQLRRPATPVQRRGLDLSRLGGTTRYYHFGVCAALTLLHFERGQTATAQQSAVKWGSARSSLQRMSRPMERVAFDLLYAVALGKKPEGVNAALGRVGKLNTFDAHFMLGMWSAAVSNWREFGHPARKKLIVVGQAHLYRSAFDWTQTRQIREIIGGLESMDDNRIESAVDALVTYIR